MAPSAPTAGTINSAMRRPTRSASTPNVSGPSVTAVPEARMQMAPSEIESILCSADAYNRSTVSGYSGAPPKPTSNKPPTRGNSPGAKHMTKAPIASTTKLTEMVASPR